MRPARFHADVLRRALRREKIATIDQLKAALGTVVDMTVFRKLREIAYHTSWSSILKGSGRSGASTSRATGRWWTPSSAS